MNNFGVRYFIFLAVIIVFFSQAIACGTQFYKVSIADDFAPEMVANKNYNNPASPSYGIHSPNGWAELPIKYYFGDKLTSEQKRELKSAMKKWEKAVGRTLFEEMGTQKGVEGDSFEDLYSSLNDGINGHYTDDDWEKTKKPRHVLATTIWDTVGNKGISEADIRFNSQYYVIGDSLSLTSVEDREVVDMQSLALHELGHLLGLSHVEAEIDKHSVMNPSLFIGEGLTSRTMSKGDIERIQQIYGCEGKSCDIEELMQDKLMAH